jgi:hypothetical protein
VLFWSYQATEGVEEDVIRAVLDIWNGVSRVAPCFHISPLDGRDIDARIRDGLAGWLDAFRQEISRNSIPGFLRSCVFRPSVGLSHYQLRE